MDKHNSVSQNFLCKNNTSTSCYRDDNYPSCPGLWKNNNYSWLWFASRFCVEGSFSPCVDLVSKQSDHFCVTSSNHIHGEIMCNRRSLWLWTTTRWTSEQEVPELCGASCHPINDKNEVRIDLVRGLTLLSRTEKNNQPQQFCGLYPSKTREKKRGNTRHAKYNVSRPLQSYSSKKKSNARQAWR